MADAKRYQVIDGPLSIRSTPNGARKGLSLAQGDEVTVAGEPVTEGGYLWVEHEQGWSAIAPEDQTETYMLDISDRDPNAPRRFRVWSNQLTIRDAANGKRLAPRLYRNTEIEVVGTSRTEAGGYIWWQHDQGWSAERNLAGNAIFLKEIFAIPEAEPVPADPSTQIPEHWKGNIPLQVIDVLKVRAVPNTHPRGTIIRYIGRGEVVTCDMDTLTVADGFYWVRHESGWSAIKSVDGRHVFLAEPGTIPGLIAIGPDGPNAKDLPDYRNLITQLPVKLDDIQWFQYYGNNMFAMRHGKSYGYDRYSQGLHGGLDFGNSIRPKPIYACMEAEFLRTEYPSTNNTRMIFQKDDYIFIYQHVTQARQFHAGDIVPAGTQIATIEHHSINNGWDHLHFEVRFMKKWIVNPLLLFTEDVYNQLVGGFDPGKANTGYKRDFPKSTNNFFYHTDKWTKWVTPLDQPMIKLGGPVIGPRGELDPSEW